MSNTSLTLRNQVESPEFKMAVARALPKHLTADRFLRISLTALTRTPKLAECDKHSFFNALLTLSQLGIEPDGRRAYLIPFENRKRGVTECQLIVSYMGLIELAMRSGLVSSLHADVVCENDEFEYDRGQIKTHKIDFRRERGEVYAVYSIAHMKDGSEQCAVMSRDEVEAIRKRSRSANSGPWVTDWNEMAKKTSFRRLAKWLTLSPEFRDAIAKDEESDVIIDAEDVTETPPARKRNALPKFDARRVTDEPAVEQEPPSQQEQEAEVVYDPNAAPEPALEPRKMSSCISSLSKSIINAKFTFEDLIEVLAGHPKYTARVADIKQWTDITDDEAKEIIAIIDASNGTLKLKAPRRTAAPAAQQEGQS